MTGRMGMTMGLAAALLLAACGGDADRAAARVGGADSADEATAPADTGAPLPQVDADTALSAVVARADAGHWVVEGVTHAAETLEISVEDGHNVLAGPTVVEVYQGRFRAEFDVAPTDLPTAYAYLTDPAGTRQWVVPVPLDRAQVTWP